MLIVAGGEIIATVKVDSMGQMVSSSPITEPRKMVSTIIPRYLAYD
jgi:hypothetical protein